MTYLVVKTVKGRQYLYQQESYRDGDKVRTRSVYVGPAEVDMRTGELSLHKRTTTPNVRISRRFIKQKVSLGALHQDHTYFSKWLSNAAQKPSILPPAILRSSFGNASCHHRKEAVTIRFPRSEKLNRTSLRKHWRVSLARVAISELSLQNPDAFANLQSGFDRDFRKSRRAILSYFKHSNQRNAPYWAMAWRWFGVAHAVTYKKGKIKPDQLGLIEYGKTKCWSDEAAQLMAEIRKSGYEAVQQQYHKRLRSCQTALKFALEERSIRVMRRRRKIKRLLAREAALQAMNRKISLVGSVFGIVR